jgi:DNA-binding transcriptional ArsR family regulator
MHRQLLTFDAHTGEVLEGLPVWFGVKPRSPYGRQWVGMNQDFLLEFARRKDVGLEVWRVFGYLNAILDFDNVIHVSQKEIATALDMKRPNVSRAMKKLEDLGIILKSPKVGRISAYRLNPNAGWKGKVSDLRPAMERHLRAVHTAQDTSE